MSYIKIEGKFEENFVNDYYVCTIISFFNYVWLTKTSIRYIETPIIPETTYCLISLKFKRARRMEIFEESIKEAKKARI